MAKQDKKELNWAFSDNKINSLGDEEVVPDLVKMLKNKELICMFSDSGVNSLDDVLQ